MLSIVVLKLLFLMTNTSSEKLLSYVIPEVSVFSVDVEANILGGTGTGEDWNTGND